MAISKKITLTIDSGIIEQQRDLKEDHEEADSKSAFQLAIEEVMLNKP